MITKQQQRNYASWWRVAAMLLAVALLVGGALSVWNTFTRAQTPAGDLQVATWIGATQASEGGQVTIKATLQNTSPRPVFKIVMDTHAVDLDGYDLSTLAVLRTAQGQTIQPTGWEAPTGGHHREGMLTFPATTADGSTIMGPDTRTVELIIRNVAGVPERTLTWTR